MLNKLNKTLDKTCIKKNKIISISDPDESRRQQDSGRSSVRLQHVVGRRAEPDDDLSAKVIRLHQWS